MIDAPGHETVELLDQTWRATAALCADLDEGGFCTPTDCPGWTVKDILSHILGTERTLRGEQPPDIEIGGDHLRNALGRFNERWVTPRRSVPGVDVLAEFRQVTAAQTAARRRLSVEEMATVVATPFGEMPLERWLDIRLFDCFSHEQDVRHALGRPGNLDGAAAARALRRGVDSLPRAVGRAARGRAGGTRVQVIVDGPLGGSWVVEVSGGRGRFADQPRPLDAVLRSDADTFLRLLCGRVSVDCAERDLGLQLSGDVELARSVAGRLVVTP